ncbi:MAG: hypothetical protein AB7I41_25025 [Candidatus Sericytochromatia bacterium]
MENALIWLGWIILAFLAAPLLLGTPLVKKTHWIAKRAQLKEWVPERDSELATWLESQRPGLTELGFQFVCYGVLDDYTPQVSTYFVLFRHPESGLAASAVKIVNPQMEIQYTEFSQLFSDGTSLNVNNSKIAPTWRTPERRIFRFPWQQDIKGLYERYQYIRQQKYPTLTGRYVDQGKELETVSAFVSKEGQDLVKAGAYLADQDPEHLVLTWPGAINAVWANSFPGKQLFAMQELGQSRRIEKEFKQSRMG